MTTRLAECTKSQQIGGYDLDFVVEPMDSLKCLFCYSVARDPWQHGQCGRIFCKSCLDVYTKDKSECPYCREEKPEYFMDNKSKREILSLMVCCKNNQNGCSWKGDVRAAQEHSELCGYHLDHCPRKCHKRVLRKDLQEHVEVECINRDYECPHCGDWGLFGERTSSHMKICPNRPTACPNEGCQELIAYHKIDHHTLSDCDCTILKCMYGSAGCTASLMRKDMAKHEKDSKHHLHIALAALSELREKLASIEILMSSAHRQYLPKTDAKKLKNDIKLGIEKIHAKCESLQQEVNDIRDKENLKMLEVKHVVEMLEELREELKDLRQKQLKEEELPYKRIQNELALVRQEQAELSRCLETQVLRVLALQEQFFVSQNRRYHLLTYKVEKLSTILDNHHQVLKLGKQITRVVYHPYFIIACSVCIIIAIFAFVLLPIKSSYS